MPQQEQEQEQVRGVPPEAVARVVLRPIGTPLPLGFIGLTVATTAFAAVQLGWVPQTQDRMAALAALAFTVPVQLLAAVLGFGARDPVAGTGMGILAGTWAVAGAATLTSPPGATSPGLGVVLVTAGLTLLVPTAAGFAKLLGAVVMGTSALRFVVTGIAEISGSPWWMTAAGVVGVVLAAVSLYAAFAFELQDVLGRAVLPVLRRGAAATAVAGTVGDQLQGVVHEAGVRQQL